MQTEIAKTDYGEANLAGLMSNQKGQGNLPGLIFGVGFSLIILAVVILVVNNVEGQPGFSPIPFKATIYLLLAVAVLIAVVITFMSSGTRMR